MAKPTKAQLDELREHGNLAPNSVFNGSSYEVNATPTERKKAVETGKMEESGSKKSDSGK